MYIYINMYFILFLCTVHSSANYVPTFWLQTHLRTMYCKALPLQVDCMRSDPVNNPKHPQPPKKFLNLPANWLEDNTDCDGRKRCSKIRACHDCSVKFDKYTYSSWRTCQRLHFLACAPLVIIESRVITVLPAHLSVCSFYRLSFLFSDISSRCLPATYGALLRPGPVARLCTICMQIAVPSE